MTGDNGGTYAWQLRGAPDDRGERRHTTGCGQPVRRPGERGLASVRHHQPILPARAAAAGGRSGEELAAARARLQALPLDTVPDPAPLPAGSHMPLLPNALFVGRAPELLALARALKSGATAAVGQAITATGLGGIGKTQLASAFTFRYGQFFAGGVFWLSFAQADAVPAEIARCGGPLALNLQPGYDGLALPDQLGLVAAAFAADLPRLLVFDNCEDEALLATWLPRSGAARVLVTSRRREWSAGLSLCAVPMGVLPRAESMALLRKFRDDLPADDPDLDAIAAELGDLPLALHMAGSFLKRYRYAIDGRRLSGRTEGSRPARPPVADQGAGA